jgi:hypothetical protein
VDGTTESRAHRHRRNLVADFNCTRGHETAPIAKPPPAVGSGHAIAGSRAGTTSGRTTSGGNSDAGNTLKPIVERLSG